MTRAPANATEARYRSMEKSSRRNDRKTGWFAELGECIPVLVLPDVFPDVPPNSQSHVDYCRMR